MRRNNDRTPEITGNCVENVANTAKTGRDAGNRTLPHRDLQLPIAGPPPDWPAGLHRLSELPGSAMCRLQTRLAPLDEHDSIRTALKHQLARHRDATPAEFVEMEASGGATTVFFLEDALRDVAAPEIPGDEDDTIFPYVDMAVRSAAPPSPGLDRLCPAVRHTDCVFGSDGGRSAPQPVKVFVDGAVRGMV
jgi:hypothetical protein